MTADGNVVSFGDNENILKLIVVMVAQLCGYTKPTELYTSSKWIVWSVLYILIKMFFFYILWLCKCQSHQETRKNEETKKHLAGVSSTIIDVNSKQGRVFVQEIKSKLKT